MSATPQGVENHRRSALADIVKQRTELVAAELKEGGATEDELKEFATPPAETQEDPNRPADIAPEEWGAMSDEEKNNAIAAAKAEEGETEEQKAAREEAERKAAEAVKPKVKIKVDGQEIEVDEDKVREAGIRALQKETAGDKRLEEAARLKKEAEETLARAQRPAPSNPAPSQGDAPLQLTDQDYLDTAKKVQFGSPEEASEALKALVAKAASTGQSDSLTMAHVSEMLDFREAMQWAHDEYKDILGEPRLKAIFVQEEKSKRAAGDNRPYRELYEEIGSGLREWRDGLKPAATPANSKETRQQRKAAIVTVPQAQARQPAPPQPKEPTPSDTIASMRKARGQA